ncbi:MAG: hypothetical protein Q8N53_10765 [Longimicrobiales bacterium]|nr:hypothetical protein [Longimicrobiales bacterium]
MTAPDLDTLVGRTTGLQPWRRLFHAATGSLVAGILLYADVPRVAAVGILGAVLGGLVVLDATRLVSPGANAIFFRAFRTLASPREAGRPASSTWYALGMTLAVAFFSPEAAVSGILVLALADPAASYVGQRWGRRPFLGASLEGTALFAAVAFAILAARHGLVPGAAGALAAALAERLSWPLDDNLTIPVVAAAVVTLLQGV